MRLKLLKIMTWISKKSRVNRKPDMILNALDVIPSLNCLGPLHVVQGTIGICSMEILLFYRVFN